MWNLIRLLPPILGPHISEGNIYWDLYINFYKFVERLCSLTFYSTEMIILSNYIERLFTKYMNVFGDTRLKSKTHFVMYYPKMIVRFGLLVKTLRFESKNEYFKGLCSNNKNRKSVGQYLTKRHQFMIYLHDNNENILPHNDAIGIKVSELPVEYLDFKHKNTVLECFNLKDTDLLCKLSSVVFDGQLFCMDDVIVVGFENGKYVFGLIEFVLSFEGGIYFLYENLETINFHLHYNSYQVIKTDNFSLCNGNQLMEYHPLCMYNIHSMYSVF